MDYISYFVQASFDPLIAVSLDGKVKDLNMPAADYFGKLRSELLGAKLEDLVWDFKKAKEAVSLTLEKGIVRGLFFQIKTRRSGRLEVRCNSSVIQDKLGNKEGLYLFLQGSSEASVDKKILEEQAKELSRSNEELRHFASLAAHDLKEPLRAISQHLKNIEKRYLGQMGSEAQEYMEYVIQASHRMNNLVDSLLAYSRVGHRSSNFKFVRVSDCVEAAIRNLEVAIKECNAQVIYEDLPVLIGDNMQLVQLFQNLINNSIKFRCDEAPIIKIMAEERSDEWVFTVKDNGIGFEKQYAEKIFQLFQRLHGRSSYPGSGIGLSLCRRIVERHGGKIWAEGIVGKGSSFYFTLSKNLAGLATG